MSASVDVIVDGKKYSVVMTKPQLDEILSDPIKSKCTGHVPHRGVETTSSPVVKKETVITSAPAYEDVRPASASIVNANVPAVVGPPALLESDDESTVGASAAGQFKPTSLGGSAAASQGRT
ncbi:hypothetical protein MTO96_043937 [Rhipicephalus appendiculatus]